MVGQPAVAVPLGPQPVALPCGGVARGAERSSPFTRANASFRAARGASHSSQTAASCDRAAAVTARRKNARFCNPVGDSGRGR